MAKTKPKTIQALIDEGVLTVEHGDYQRIANLTKKANGSVFTADYVRKVLLGLRANKAIARKARLYLRRKEKLNASLTEA